MKCETCEWWKFVNGERIFANISTGHSDYSRDRIQLRRCKFTPHPSQLDDPHVYTDSEYVCGCWREATKDE